MNRRGRCCWSCSARASSSGRSSARRGRATPQNGKIVMFEDNEERRRLREELRSRDRRRADNPWTRLVWGLAVLAAGIIGWLDHTGGLHASDYLRWWPVVVIALGLAHLARGQWVTTVVLVAIGTLFLPPLPFLPHLHPWMLLGLWPLMISVGGVALIRQALVPVAKNAAANNSFH